MPAWPNCEWLLFSMVCVRVAISLCTSNPTTTATPLTPSLRLTGSVWGFRKPLCWLLRLTHAHMHAHTHMKTRVEGCLVGPSWHAVGHQTVWSAICHNTGKNNYIETVCLAVHAARLDEATIIILEEDANILKFKLQFTFTSYPGRVSLNNTHGLLLLLISINLISHQHPAQGISFVMCVFSHKDFYSPRVDETHSNSATC